MSARNEKTALAGGLFEGDTELTLLSPGNGSVRGKQLPKVPASLAVTCRIFQANSLSTPVTEGHHLWRFVVPARIGSMSLLPCMGVVGRAERGNLTYCPACDRASQPPRTRNPGALAPVERNSHTRHHSKNAWRPGQQVGAKASAAGRDVSLERVRGSRRKRPR